MNVYVGKNNSRKAISISNCDVIVYRLLGLSDNSTISGCLYMS